MKKVQILFSVVCLLFVNLLNAQYNEADFEPIGQGPYFANNTSLNPNVNTSIYAYPAGAEAYQFVVIEYSSIGLGVGECQTGSIETTTNSFKLSDIYFNDTHANPVHYVKPEVSYFLFVKYRKNGVWTKFGYATINPLNNSIVKYGFCKAVNFPVIKNSNFNPVQCGSVLTSGDQLQAKTSFYLGQPTAPAIATFSPFSYVWKITRLSDNLTTQIFRTTNSILFRRVDNPGTANDLNLDIGSDTGQNPAQFIRPNETYRFELGIRYPDGTSYILPITACEFTTPSNQNKLITTDDGIDNMYSDNQKINAVAYPNPFTNYFKIFLDSKFDEFVKISIFDNLGQKTDEESILLSQLIDFELGSKYKSGFYTVILELSGETKLLKIIKQ